jgi:hypothetical protein
MRNRSILVAASLIFIASVPAFAQDMALTDPVLDQFITGLNAERAELDKVGAQLTEIDDKIAKFKECSELLKEAGGLGGKSGLAAKVAMKAKCGATSDDGMRKDRAKLLDQPEKIGAAAAGMKRGDYAHMKERVTGYLNGARNYSSAELKALNARAQALSDAMRIPLSAANANNEDRGTGISGRIGNAIAGQVRMFTPDMTWAYVSYLWGMMYMSGATMFEQPYKPGQWTKWEIKDASQADTKMVLERALLSREGDGSEWWRIKSINVSPESSDTITLESQFKKMDESGIAMQVVRMRGKLPGDTEGKELMVPQHLSMLSMTAFPFKPTPESVAGATVGTESIKVGSSSYSSKHVKFGAGGGNMEWWLADNAPGGVVRIQFTGQEKDEKWIMEMVGAGSGAKSELGVK